MRSADPSASAVVPERLRRLEWNELVKRGDWVEDGRQGFEPWVGPNGFRADAFIKKIYRKLSRNSIAANKAQ